MTDLLTRASLLTTLTHAPASATNALAEALLDLVGEVTVLQNRTALVMLPFTDTATGVRFHLGEILVAEAHVRLESGHEGYAAVVGRDLVQAVGIAVIDAVFAAGVGGELILRAARDMAAAQAADDDLLLRQVEATRIEMETF